jgi:glycolate oxidase iron-sulfur subunit
MQTQLSTAAQATTAGQEAADILRSCVHCGFCTATCPTYQLLGDELDGPRGRIYLIKQVLEGETVTVSTQQHLDRCLTCRGCETTCPSGVQYGRLLDIGRHLVDENVPRPLLQRWLRRLLAAGLTGPMFAPALELGQWMRPLLPDSVAARIPLRSKAGSWPRQIHKRRMLLLEGCVQPAMSPNINLATARIFDAAGIELVRAADAGCCGAIRHHLGDQAGGLDDVRRNVDAWWPHVKAGAEAIVMNASGCGAMVREYGHLLRHDPAYADRASRLAAMTRDVVELVPALLPALVHRLTAVRQRRIAFHSPCSLQHGQKISGEVEKLLLALGAELLPVPDGHLCCGSAGTYSLLQPKLSGQLRTAKVRALTALEPEVILSANVGCIHQLTVGTEIPVQHWIEWLDERLIAAA